MDLDTSLNRMKELIDCGKKDSSLKPNVSETVEYTIEAADGKTYGIVRERKRYFIKEKKEDGTYDYIGGIGNKHENEYPSYNSAFRNIELKIRSINESKNNGEIFQAFEKPKQSEFIIEATTDMRNELDRVKQIMNNASKIMSESNTEFITKPKFKDTESFGTATDPKKQGEPFNENPGEYKGDIDPKNSSKTAKNSGKPFEKEVKPAPEKMDIETTNKKPSEAGKFGEDAKNVPAGSVANQKPKGGKVVKVTEAQMKAAQKALKEGYFDDDYFGGDDYDEDPLLKQFDYPEINKLGRSNKPIPASIDGDDDLPTMDDEEEDYDVFDPTRDLDQDALPVDDFNDFDDDITEMNEGFFDSMKAVGSVGKYLGNKTANSVKGFAKGIGDKANQFGQDVSQQYNKSKQNSSTQNIEKIAAKLKSELDNLNNRTIKAGGQPINYKSVLAVLSNQLSANKNVNMGKFRNESVDDFDDFDDNITEMNEGFFDSMKAVGSVGKYLGNKTANSVKGFAKGIGDKANQFGQDVSQQYNKSKQNSSTQNIEKIAAKLKSELDNLNNRTIKAGGQPINYKSVLAVLSNQLSANKNANMSKFRNESVDEELVKKITEEVLNVFGKHATYQKPAFTTPSNNQPLVAGTKEWDDESVKKDSPYGQKIGNSAPFTEPVKQKVGEGEIGEDGDEVMKGKTQQTLPNSGEKGDTKPFKKPVEKSGDKIAKGTPVQKGETQQGEPKLGQKGDVQPFGKKVNKEGVKESSSKEEFLNKLTESIINRLKKK